VFLAVGANTHLRKILSFNLNNASGGENARNLFGKIYLEK
jgi:hypothetical protein